MNAFYNFPLTGGLNRGVFPFRAAKDSFYTLQNLRQARQQRGLIEQTPYFGLSNQAVQGTYYSGGSLTEPTTSAIRALIDDTSGSGYTISDYVMMAANSSYQVQIFYQTVYPAAETAFTGLLLVINDLPSLGITLGQTLDVEMTGPAAFRWRKNGGGWTAGVPAIAGVNIDTNRATLYFLADTGFAGTETWSWQRTDYTVEPGAGLFVRTRPLPVKMTKNGSFFINNNDRVMALRLGGTDPTPYVISVGYRPVYANFLTNFSDHLFLVGASKTLSAPSARNRTWASSDKSNFDNFFSTSVNEADMDLLWVSTSSYFESLDIIGVAVLNTFLYIITGSEIYYSPDLGLPNVYSFQKLKTEHIIGTVGTANCIISTDSAIYITTDRTVLLFDGNSLINVGFDVRSFFSVTTQPFGAFDFVNKELNIVLGTTILVYQVDYQIWYTRGAFFNSSTPNGPTAIAVATTTGLLYCGARSRTLLVELTNWSGTPVFDSAGTTWTIPTLVTQVIGDSLRRVKESVATYLGIIASGPFTPSSSYVTGANVRFKLSWILCNDGQMGSSVLTDALAYTDLNQASGNISFPRVSFRGLVYQITIVDPNATKPPAQTGISAIEISAIAATESIAR